MIKHFTSDTSYLLCVRLHVSVLIWPSSGLLTNQVNRCWQHLWTWFVRRSDNGHERTETCSLTHNKCDVFDVNCFIVSVLNFNTSGCLQ